MKKASPTKGIQLINSVIEEYFSPLAESVESIVWGLDTENYQVVLKEGEQPLVVSIPAATVESGNIGQIALYLIRSV